MANNFITTKVLHVSEEAAPLVQLPIMVGNEVFMLTQQDVRRVEDTRHMSYSRVSPIPNLTSISQTGELQNIISHNCNKNQEPMLVANVSQQLNWAKMSGSAAPSSMRYSVATSTDAFKGKEPNHVTFQCRQTSRHCSCQTKAQTASKACNTEPIKIQKQRLKVCRFCETLSEASS